MADHRRVSRPIERQGTRNVSSHRRNLLRWLWNRGKNPKANIGYAESTVKSRSYQLDKFYRWVWDIEDGYTEAITVSHANAYMKYLYPQSYSETYKSASQKAVHCLFKWQRYDLGKDVDWDPVITYNDSSNLSTKDPLTREERSKLRETALSRGSIPNYHSLTPEKRDEWKAHLAQRLGKPKFDIGIADFAKTDSWKWPSLVWTSLDAGLRPKEVEKAKVSWLDLKNGMLRSRQRMQ